MGTILYQIRNWDENFENNKSRERTRLSWCAVPNKQDGLGYGRLITMEDGPALYGAFIATVLVASKQQKPRNGYLTDTGRALGRPYTANDLSIKTRIPADLIQKMLDVVSSNEIGWVVKLIDFKEINGECQHGAREVPDECPLDTLEEKRREGKEGKGKKPPSAKKQKKQFIPPTESEVIQYFADNGYSTQAAKKAFQYYDSAGWKDSRGKPVLSWKQKMISVWFKDENKAKDSCINQPSLEDLVS